MDPRRITDDFFVSPQITPDDMPAVKAAGFRSILCNRPDNEDPGQPGYDEVAQAAGAADLEIRAVPIVSGQMTDADTEAFRDAVTALPKPILAYCRSGTRCTVMWSLTHIDALGGDAVLRATADAGYDMSGLVAQINRRT
ncbi:TIGR01244 family sulfur transferase [Roseovarius tibetensis]|uniref:TIGR01244 family sulfur transferase n=1 Tax=Roseovarius tibetensis TaxID=2685897 RepID=UPI003D7F9731